MRLYGTGPAKQKEPSLHDLFLETGTHELICLDNRSNLANVLMDIRLQRYPGAFQIRVLYARENFELDMIYNMQPSKAFGGPMVVII